MKMVLLIIGPSSNEKVDWDETFRFYTNSPIQEILEGSKSAIQVALNTWLIDIEQGLAELAQVVNACRESRIPYLVFYDLHQNGNTTDVLFSSTSSTRAGIETFLQNQNQREAGLN
ncbi:MAG TPA: hypothetical protein VN937_00535 [Blastocatellia bacterium]|nr:hypothetical protein [Blastocatellia bacterium]